MADADPTDKTGRLESQIEELAAAAARCRKIAVAAPLSSAAVIEIGAKEFMCIGATPPFDHPHVFCDMGDENEFICSYCSTLYRFNPSLHGYEARPAECAWVPAAA